MKITGGRGLFLGLLRWLICKKDYGISRMEMIIKPPNKASIWVAEKSGYKKEGLLKKYIKNPQGVLVDYYLYAKRI